MTGSAWRIVYDGQVPARPSEFNRLAAGTGVRDRFVYIFLDGSLPLYVGMTGNPRGRFDSHRRKKPWWASADRLVLAGIRAGDPRQAEASARRLETGLIRELNPAHNIVGVTH